MDDGYKVEHTLALELFNTFKIPACSAVTSNFVGKTKLGTNEPYVNKEELLEMQSCGWEILSHGKTHRELDKLSIYETENELKLSKQELTNMGLLVENLVYPCHSYNDNVKFFASRFYASARGRHGFNNISDKYELAGIQIDDHTRLEEYKQFIDENRGWLIFYCHLCTSKIISSTVVDRLNTLQSLIEYISDLSIIKTVKEYLNEYQRTSS
jgi:peptidoglycan/xylan/chitin deacetylase (PgdA/CDA1 family)